MFHLRLQDLRDPFCRARVLSLLSVLLVFVGGWTLVLGLWLVHLVLLFRWTPYRGLRIFYAALAVLAGALLVWNGAMLLSALAQL